jgi:hypothetical protein
MSIINIFSDLSTKFSLKSLEEGIRFFESLPTPEESLVEAKRQETELESTVQKIKEKIIEIENKISENPEELEELNDSSVYLKTQLENYEAELAYVKEQKVMFKAIASEDDDNFIDNIPTFYDAMKTSVDKQIKDVKETISIIKKTKRHIEICIECKKKIRDEKGRKASVKHYHINLLKFDDVNIRNYENDEYIYTPVICESCMSSEIPEDISVLKNCSKGEIDYGYLVNFDKKTLIELSKKYLTLVEELVKIDEIKYKEKIVGTKGSETEEESAMSEKETLKYFIDFFKSISDVCDCEECIEIKNKQSEKYKKLEEMLEENEHKIEVIEE